MTLDDALRALVREEIRAVLVEARPAPAAPAPAPGEGDDRALTVHEAAEFARYTVETLLERVRAGDLPAHKPRGSREWRIRLGDLKAWLWRSERGGGAKVLDLGELSAIMRGSGGAR